MKNPNGYGGIVKLSGNRRKPYMARKTVGWSDKGYPIYRAIGYAETREEALIMLAQYNKSPFDLDTRKITVGEIYDKYITSDSLKNTRSKSTVLSSSAAWNHCKKLSSLPYRDLRAYHIKECIDECNLSYASKNAIRTLFINLDKFALERDVVDKCYSGLVESIPIPPTSKKIFTSEEIALAWENQDKPVADMLLVLLYSGWRISELLGLKKEDIDLDQRTMKGGVKTKNGKDRIVPIHPKIQPFIEARYKNAKNPNDYIFDITRTTFRNRWSELFQAAEFEHTPHECRHTFRSALDSAGGNKVSIDLLMGHASGGTGERVYTHKTVEQLRETILLLPY